MAGPLGTRQTPLVLRLLAHELDETDGAAGLDDAVSDVRDHRFRHGPFEHYGGDEPGSPSATARSITMGQILSRSSTKP